MQGINWYVFTVEEQNAIKALIGKGNKDDIVCCVESINMDLEKEAEIQKIVDQMTPDDEDFISEIEDEVSADFIEGTPEQDKTPEMEAEYQKKLDKERAKHISKKKKKKEEEANKNDKSEDDKSDKQ